MTQRRGGRGGRRERRIFIAIPDAITKQTLEMDAGHRAGAQLPA